MAWSEFIAFVAYVFCIGLVVAVVIRIIRGGSIE